MTHTPPLIEQSDREHVRTTINELGYDRGVCAECGVDWPCVDYVMARCARLNLAHGLPCECGWHDEKVAQDPEQEKREGSDD